MIFTEGTILKPVSRLTLYQHSSYIPIGNAVKKLEQWQKTYEHFLTSVAEEEMHSFRIYILTGNW